ncbi:MAG TPA: hypothetical protein VFS54_02435 [Solirubrobacterales bacterium]|nr:hypothetical protein [Solirubrobacterales bacterium]
MNRTTGDVYVADGINSRIQQFTASGEFIRAWGTDVVTGGETGFEICTVSTSCKAGTTAGGIAGQVAQPMGIAVDQETGYLYVTGNTNRRVDVFTSSGAFAGAFGWGVDTGAAALEVCTTASTCQVGVAGAGAGQFPTNLIASSPSIDPTAPAGTIFVPEQGNARVSKFFTTVSGGVLTSASFVKAFGWDVAPGAVSEEQEVRVQASAGQFKLNFEAEATTDLSFDAVAADVQAALNALPSIGSGGGTVSVSGGPGDPDGSSPYVIRFDGGPLAGTNVTELGVSNGTVPLSGGSGASVLNRAEGGTSTGLESCTTASGCKVGAVGGGSGQFTGAAPAASAGSPSSAAVDSTGSIYVVSGPYNNPANDCTTAAPCRIQKFNPATTAATDFGPSTGPGQITNTTSLSAGEVVALDVAIDPATGHVFVNKKTGSTTYRVFEYDNSGAFVESHPPGDLTSTNLIITHGLAVGTEERLYSGLTGTSVYLLGPVPDPIPTMEDISDVGQTTATLEGTVDIPAPGAPAFITKYHFEYSANGSTWLKAPAQDQPVGDGSPGPHPVSVEVTGLEPNTFYVARLVASTGNAPVVSGTSGFTTGQVAPSGGLTYAEEVTQSAARLGARIDPQGLKTSYHFEWTTQSAWEETGTYANRAPAFDRQIGGNEPVIVQETIQGLEPETAYRFRVVAGNAAGQMVGEPQGFETLNACGFTGGRCLEMVSPANKGPVGAAGDLVVAGQELQFQAAFQGSSIAYVVGYGLKDATASGEVVYQSNRQPAGWATSQLSGPAILPSVDVSGSVPSKIGALARNLNCGVILSMELLTPNAPVGTRNAGAANLYRRNADGSYSVITELEPLNADGLVPLDRFDVIGMQEDGVNDCGTVMFRTDFQYPGVPGAGAQRLYEWDGGNLYNAGVVPGSGGLEVAEVIPGASDQGGPFPGGQQLSNAWGTVSEDGSRTYFTAISRLGGDIGQQAVFMRERTRGIGDLSAGSAAVANASPSAGNFHAGQEIAGPGVAPGTTIASVGTGTLELSQPATATLAAAELRAVRVIDVSQSQNPGMPNESRSQYETASADGSVVLFTARAGLTESGTPPSSTSCVIGDSEAPNGPGCSLYRYSIDDGTLSELSVPAAETDNANGASVAGVLGASADGSRVYFAARGQLLPDEAASEAENLADGAYNVYLSDDGQLSYVGRLGGNAGVVRNALLSSSGQFWSSRVSPDGRYLLFPSQTPFTELGQADNGTRREAYLYDSDSQSVTCISCRKDDQPSQAPEDAEPLTSGGWDVENALKPPTTLAVSEEGKARAFFVSYNRLATGATEGRPNLYMWENGQTSFLGSSAPSAVKELRFAGASATGDDVYFTTVDRLTWQDTDSKLDVYDVRVGGGFDPPLPPPAPCDPLGEGACQGSTGTGPSPGPVPGSATFVGPERVEEPSKKGKPAKKKGKKKKGKKQKKKGKGKRGNRTAASQGGNK